MEEGKEVEYLFYVGCSGAYDSRSRSIIESMVKILNASGVSWGTLGNEERCCGDSIRRLGNEYVFEQMAIANIRIFDKYNIKKIVTTCPHGYSTFKNDYQQYGATFEVYHHTEFIDSLIKEGKLKINSTDNGNTVFHDSCYLGRYNNLYEAPRDILTKVSNGKAPLEMQRCKQESFCCGAGGGRMWLEETVGKRIYQERTQEALEQNPSTIAVACPFCMTMFEDGVKQENKENDVKVKDIAEIVSESIN
jgi:Fe-S oxidoreductase